MPARRDTNSVPEDANDALRARHSAVQEASNADRSEQALRFERAKATTSTSTPQPSDDSEPELMSGGTAGTAGPVTEAARAVGDPMESFDQQRGPSADMVGNDTESLGIPAETGLNGVEQNLRHVVELVFGQGAPPVFTSITTSSKDDAIVASDAPGHANAVDGIGGEHIDHVAAAIGDGAADFAPTGIELAMDVGLGDAAEAIDEVGAVD